MSQVKVELDGSIYKMSKEQLTQLLVKTSDIKNELKEKAIYCIRKGSTAIMLNQVYGNDIELQKDLKYYRENGFKVCYTNGKG